ARAPNRGHGHGRGRGRGAGDRRAATSGLLLVFHGSSGQGYHPREADASRATDRSPPCPRRVPTVCPRCPRERPRSGATCGLGRRSPATAWEAPMELGLSGKVAIVTGASQGVGLATVERLAAEGARLALCARGQEGLD